MRLAAAVVVSVLSHLAVATAAAHVSSWGDRPPRAASAIEFDVFIAAPPRTLPLPEQQAEPVPVTAVLRRRMPQRAAAQPPSETALPEHSVAAPHVQQAPAPPGDLSPQHVAQLAIATQPTGGQPPNEPASTPELGAPPSAVQNGAAKLDSLLAEAARNTALSTPPDPVLRHRPDGSYTYRGLAMGATIDPDGQVHFHDSYSEFTGVGGSLDFFGWLEHKHHNDIYRSRRRWFLERTAGLREALATANRRQRATLRGDALLHALQAIWSDAKLSVARRKQETLGLWDAQPADAEDCHALILTFVRERCPRASACAFQPAELETFNRGRTGPVFEP